MTRRRGARGRSACAIGVLTLALPALAACGPARDASEPEDVSALVSAGAVVLDVRSPAEFSRQHLEGALNLDSDARDFRDRLGALDPGATYLVYCRSGARADVAVATMEELGFSAVVDGGGLRDLVAQGLTTRPR